MSNNPEICINIAFNESREFEGLWLDLSKPLIESYRDIKAIADIRQLTVKSYDIKGWGSAKEHALWAQNFLRPLVLPWV